MNKLTTLVICMLFAFDCFSQSYISKQKAIEDIDFYTMTLQEVHYNPFLYVEKRKFFREVEKLKRNLPDSVSTEDFIIALYQLSAIMEDSHSSPNVVQTAIVDELRKAQFFPYKLVIEDNRLYVPKSTSIASGLPVGAEIISINDKKVKPFLKQAQKYTGGLPAYKLEMTNTFLSYFLYLSDIKAPFVMAYKDATGKKRSTTIGSGQTFMNVLKLTVPGIVESYSFSMLENKLGYIDFKSMSGDWKVFGSFLDYCITTFNENNIRHVAIDLRQNSGGNSTLGDLLFSYFADKGFSLSGGKHWKVSQQYKDYLLANGNATSEYLKQKNGTVWEIGSCGPKESMFTVDQKFTGKLYLLTGPFTFSSANMVSDGAKQFKLAEIIGEPTGETTSDFGEVYSFTLPNSKIVMNSTTSFDIGADCDRGNIRPVMPDVLIKRGLDDKIQERDKALEYLLNNIR